MKIKNVSQQELKIAIPSGKDVITSTVKPNQVMYCEDNSSVTKQLVIYEKKKLLTIEKKAEKPDYVENYRPYFESGTYFPNKKAVKIDLDDELDDAEIEGDVMEVESISEFISAEEEEGEAEPTKRGRGRPKKPVSEQPADTEKKKRGRPKGSTKNTQQ